MRWYLRYSLSFCDVEELLGERSLGVNHTTIRPLGTAPDRAGQDADVAMERIALKSQEQGKRKRERKAFENCWELLSGPPDRLHDKTTWSLK